MIFFFFPSSLNSLRRSWARTHTHTHTRIYGIHSVCIGWWVCERVGKSVAWNKCALVWVLDSFVVAHDQLLRLIHRQGMAAILNALLCFGACTLVYRLARCLLMTQPFAHVIAVWEFSIGQARFQPHVGNTARSYLLDSWLSSIFEHFFFLFRYLQ